MRFFDTGTNTPPAINSKTPTIDDRIIQHSALQRLAMIVYGVTYFHCTDTVWVIRQQGRQLPVYKTQTINYPTPPLAKLTAKMYLALEN